MSDRTRRILVVEDEFIVAEALAEWVRAVGCQCVGPAITLKEAVGLATDEPLDAAILDVRLEHDRVDPVAEILAERGIPFAFATADYSGLPAWCREHLVVLKPYSEIGIREVVSRLISD